MELSQYFMQIEQLSDYPAAKFGKEMLFSVEQAFVRKAEMRAPLKTPTRQARKTANISDNDSLNFECPE